LHRVDPETNAPRKVMDTIPTTPRMRRWLSAAAYPPVDFDLRWIGALLFRNGQIEETGIAAGVSTIPPMAWPGSPSAGRPGRVSRSGEVVLAGSFTRPVDIIKATTFHADYGQSDRCPASSLNNKRPRESSDDKAQEHSYRRVQARQSHPRTPAASAIS